MRKINDDWRRAVLALLTAVLLISGMAAGQSITAEAASKPQFEGKKVVDRLTFSQKDNTSLEIIGSIKKSKVKNVKSSDTSVATAKAKWDKTDKVWYIDLNVKKAGTTKISCTVNQGGKNYALSCEYTATKWVNPIQELIIGNDTYDEDTKNFFTKGSNYFSPVSQYSYEKMVEEHEEDDDYEDYEASWKKYASDVDIRAYMKNGYKLKKIYIEKSTLDWKTGGDSKVVKKLKNGASVNLTKYGMKLLDYSHDIVFEVYDTKLGDTFKLYVENVWGPTIY